MIASLLPRTFCGTSVHLGVAGSIAAYKALDLLRLLRSCGCRVGVTLTDSARRFVTPESFRALGAHVVYEGMFAPGQGTPFPHLKPGQEDHCLLIAPATANILAKLAHGLADDLLSCQALAFKGPALVAPAMNPAMWAAPATRRNWEILRELGYQGIEPDAGDVACGDTGRGRLPAIEVLAAHVLRHLSPQDLAGRKVLVSLGPTREYWDRVRFLSNPSSGKMGAAIALAAWLRGAEVTAVCGPVPGSLTQGLSGLFPLRPVTTAAEMHAACLELMPETDIVCMTAAVADFAPIPVSTGKYKKSAMGEEGISLQCQPVADILADLGKRKGPQQTLIGFAAETGAPDAEANRKLAAKNLDMILANRIDTEGSGFESDTNEVTLLARNGRRETWPRLPKPEVAWRIWDFLPCL
jgi:phosphopantothenoylcysteine decarboxylase/phosphopantothenate--cysteine ligase